MVYIRVHRLRNHSSSVPNVLVRASYSILVFGIGHYIPRVNAGRATCSSFLSCYSAQHNTTTGQFSRILVHPDLSINSCGYLEVESSVVTLICTKVLMQF
jgi:hypothetical protein